MEQVSTAVYSVYKVEGSTTLLLGQRALLGQGCSKVEQQGQQGQVESPPQCGTDEVQRPYLERRNERTRGNEWSASQRLFIDICIPKETIMRQSFTRECRSLRIRSASVTRLDEVVRLVS